MQDARRTRDVVVIGASAGGVGPLMTICAALPPTFRATILVAVHLPPEKPSAPVAEIAPILLRLVGDRR
jgi:two-component system chemotaxis response regulator CheB